MNRSPVVLFLTVTIFIGGCRSCGEDKERGRPAVSGPTMPPGMLVPSDAPAAPAAATSSLRVARNVKAGPWTELQVARPGDRAERLDFQHWRDDSVFVSLEAMTLLHEAFARALPGFDLFLPRLYGPDALTKLATELSAFEKRSAGDIAATALEIAALANELATKRQSLWVLGP